MFNSISRFFDKLEDKVRIKLSHFPIFFAFLGGIAIVEFWRGIWQITDWFFEEIIGLSKYGWESNFISILISSFILLITGLYVSLFLSGDSVIISGRKGELKKKFEKTEEEIKAEGQQIKKLEEKIDLLINEISDIKKNVILK